MPPPLLPQPTKLLQLLPREPPPAMARPPRRESAPRATPMPPPPIPTVKVATIADLENWVFMLVHSAGFEAWHKKAVVEVDRVLVRTGDGVGLWARRDKPETRTAALSHAYVEVNSRSNFKKAVHTTCRHWGVNATAIPFNTPTITPTPSASSSTSSLGSFLITPTISAEVDSATALGITNNKEAHTKIVFKGIVWQLGWG